MAIPMKNFDHFLKGILFVLATILLIPQVCGQEEGKVPSMATWSMRRDIIDLAAKHTPFKVLTSLRGAGNNLDHFTDEVHDQFKSMADYAGKQGIHLVADLDIRMALNSFEKKHPSDLQEMLVLKEVDPSAGDASEVTIRCRNLSDHYKTYQIRSGNFVSAFSYSLTPAGLIDPETLKDISKSCDVVSTANDLVQVKLPALQTPGSKIMVLVSFKILYPDVFAPSTIEFQREIMEKYADIPLAGVLKDEWGFPPSLSEETIFSDYWYSDHMAEAYSKRTGGRDLKADFLLMAKGIKGKENERLLVINHFNEMNWERNGEIEDDFYQTVKKIWGPDALVTVHSTWFPFPEAREFKKHGLDWWITRRDLAQTDEIVPYAARTSLAKKWGGKVWYNMDHTIGLPPQTIINADHFVRHLWSSALAGGRINNLPSDVRPEGIVSSDYIRAETRIHLLNYIGPSPLDCPVAVIFGHTSAMNWAGKGFDDVGMKLVDSFWAKGIPADLIPSSEIWNGSLRIDSEGYVCYGKQRYSAVILYNPEFEKETTAEFFTKASKGRKTSLYRVGKWTKDPEGNDFNGDNALPAAMNQGKPESIMAEITGILKKAGIPLQSPATRDLEGFGHTSLIPPTTGFCRLVDGTLIQVAGTNNGSGDPIKSTMRIGKQSVRFDAVGVAAVRLDKDGKVEALAAGGLKFFESGDLKISLNERMDLALWKNEKGEMEGVIQGLAGEIPPQLKALTGKWKLISLPEPYPLKGKAVVKSAVVKESANSSVKSGFVTDIDGNRYKTAQIGNQTWMTENLRTGRYADGTSIAGDYSWYQNDSAKYNVPYGKLYKGNVLVSKSVCPSGWHVPSSEEWTGLIEHLEKTKSTNGFNPVAGGYKWGFGNNFVSLDKNGNWWSSSGTNKRVAWNREKQLLYYIEDRGLSAEYGLSVRCVKD